MMRKIQVRCYSSYTYAQEPLFFTWQEEENRVEKIEKEWREPSRKFFKVTTDSGKSFELCYNEANDQWSAIEVLVQERP